MPTPSNPAQCDFCDAIMALVHHDYTEPDTGYRDTGDWLVCGHCGAVKEIDDAF